jgi:hypothetical protein
VIFVSMFVRIPYEVCYCFIGGYVACRRTYDALKQSDLLMLNEFGRVE